MEVDGHTLSAEQLKPIKDNSRFSLICAGAGTGKTMTMVGKIKYLLDNNILNSDQILAISFTNKAVDNLKEKIYLNTGKDVCTLTFHKLALNILKNNNIPYKIVTNNYLSYIIDEFLNTYCFDNKQLLKCFFNYNHILFRTKDKYLKLIKDQSFKDLIITFISLFKANNYDINYFNKIINKHNQNIISIIYAIYLIYQRDLEAMNALDFDDIISKATSIIKDNNLKLKYKLIIIDEAQDTSNLRFNLIKAIIDNNKASLCMVGDDFQSIYHFSGCDLSLFLDFKTYFLNVNVYYLQETYRNSQSLLDIVGSFIMKNPYQIKKHLRSSFDISNPINIVYFFNYQKIIPKLLKDITGDIFILGRTNFSLNRYYKGKLPSNVKYLTIHQAKGLEVDNVIILDLENYIYGIPSLKQDERLLSYVKKYNEYPYAEERRLLYVAITRAKKKVYLLTPYNNPSIFIKELKHHKLINKIYMN